MSSTLFTPPLPRFLNQNLQEETCILNKCPGLENTDLVWHLKSFIVFLILLFRPDFLPFAFLRSGALASQAVLHAEPQGLEPGLPPPDRQGKGQRILVFPPATQVLGTSAEGKLGFLFSWGVLNWCVSMRVFFLDCLFIFNKEFCIIVLGLSSVNRSVCAVWIVLHLLFIF